MEYAWKKHEQHCVQLPPQLATTVDDESDRDAYRFTPRSSACSDSGPLLGANKMGLYGVRFVSHRRNYYISTTRNAVKCDNLLNCLTPM